MRERKGRMRSAACLLLALVTGAGEVFGEGGMRLPLAVGNWWEYRVEAVRQGTEPDSPRSGAWEAAVRWEVAAEEEVLGERAFRLVTTERFVSGPDSGKVVSSEAWFAARGDTVRGIATRIQGEQIEPIWAQLLKPVVQEAPEPDPWHFVTLIYPLEVGRSWRAENLIASFQEEMIDRKEVEAEEAVVVPAGAFAAVRVAYTLQGSGIDVRLEQWFSAAGMVRMRVVERTGMTKTDDQGEAIGILGEELNAEMVLERFRLVDPPTAVETASWGAVKWLRR